MRDISCGDRGFGIRLEGPTLVVSSARLGATLELGWPAVTVGLRGDVVRFVEPESPPVAAASSICQTYVAGALRCRVTVRIAGPDWLRKRVEISSDVSLPTPDYVEVDRQALPADRIRRRGYRATTDAPGGEARQEEGAGVQVGCGYPLVGDCLFLGLEHPAGFAHTEDQGAGHLVWLRHHPVWRGHELGVVDEVLGWSPDAAAAFAAYLEGARLPCLGRPFVTFCTFWTDPYAGDLEYETSRDAYAAYFRGFAALGLVPDAFTLDAGWYDRRSLLQAKPSVGGDRGLRSLKRLARSLGSDLSLWVSSNGPIAVHPDYLRSRGYAVGGGASATYSGEGFGIMMDGAYAAAMEERWLELVRDVGAIHLKVDWDNECSTNESFAATYPTADHVRQAGVDAFFSMAARARTANPRLITRHGMWSSPWWLMAGNHVFLADSGDSEFTSLPGRSPRQAATTHRDLMYYNHLRRDGSVLPLDCIDTHEFPDAPRNPFPEDPATWVDTVWLSFLRGSTYLAYTLCPESLEQWQADSMAQIMEFCRVHRRHIFTPWGGMILGHPGRGEVYGFLHRGPAESWCVLRNPLPVPQVATFRPEAACGHPVRHTLQLYPCFQTLDPEAGLLMLGHEVRVVVFFRIGGPRRVEIPCTVSRHGSRYEYRFPSTIASGRAQRALVHPMHRVGPLDCLSSSADKTERGLRYRWFLQVPARMRDAEVQLALGHDGAALPRAFFSRYESGPGACALPLAVMRPSPPGYGERKNFDGPRAPERLYAAIRVPAGGRFSLTLEVDEGPTGMPLEQAWVVGFEAPKRDAKVADRPPAPFGRRLPYQHPLGFGRALALPLPSA